MLFIFISGVRECSDFILLQATVQFPLHHVLKKLSFLLVISCFLCHKLIYLGVCFISGLSILFHQSVSVLCQYHAVLIPVALYYSQQSGSMTLPVLFFFLKTALGTWGLNVSCSMRTINLFS